MTDLQPMGDAVAHLPALAAGAAGLWMHQELPKVRERHALTPVPRWAHASFSTGLMALLYSAALTLMGTAFLEAYAVMVLGVVLFAPVCLWDWLDRGAPPPSLSQWRRDMGAVSLIAALATPPTAFLAVLSSLQTDPVAATRIAVLMVAGIVVAAMTMQLMVPRNRTMLLACLAMVGPSLTAAVIVATLTDTGADGRTAVLLVYATVMTTVMTVTLVSMAQDVVRWWLGRRR